MCDLIIAEEGREALQFSPTTHPFSSFYITFSIFDIAIMLNRYKREKRKGDGGHEKIAFALNKKVF